MIADDCSKIGYRRTRRRFDLASNTSRFDTTAISNIIISQTDDSVISITIYCKDEILCDKNVAAADVCYGALQCGGNVSNTSTNIGIIRSKAGIKFGRCQGHKSVVIFCICKDFIVRNIP